VRSVASIRPGVWIKPGTREDDAGNQITGRLAMSKFGIWIWCSCHIRV